VKKQQQRLYEADLESVRRINRQLADRLTKVRDLNRTLKIRLNQYESKEKTAAHAEPDAMDEGAPHGGDVDTALPERTPASGKTTQLGGLDSKDRYIRDTMMP